MRIPFNRPAIVGAELANIADAVAKGQLSGDGPYTRRCHAWLEQRLGVPKALLTHSGTAALEMATLLLDIRPGDEVVMPSFTFVSTANAFVLRGGVPVFVDIRPDTLNLDERLVEAALTPRTRAIVPVHYGGVPCEMDALAAIARRHGLRVVEDAAQALLSSYRGRPAGALGDLGCLSFHETKNVISGEGGALLVNDPALAARAEILREKGTNRSQFFRGEVDKYTWMDLGSSYLPGELTAAFLHAQLEHADAIVAERRGLCALYAGRLGALEQRGLALLPAPEPAHCRGNGHMFHLRLPDLATRSALINRFRERGILAVFHYVPLHSSPAGRRYGRAAAPLPVTDAMGERLLRLPLYHGMGEAAVEEVAGEVLRFFGLGNP